MKKILAVLSLLLLIILLTSAGQADEVKLDVPYYAQGKETPWADTPLGVDSELTIRTHGCALTCISMVVSYHEDKKLTPPDMNKWLAANNGFEEGWSGGESLGLVVLRWPALAEYGEGWVYTRFNWRARPADLVLIRYYLDHAIPVVAEVTYKSAPHYVVLTGYSANDFWVNDPEFPDQHSFNSLYNLSDKWGAGPARNINGIRVLYPGE